MKTSFVEKNNEIDNPKYCLVIVEIFSSKVYVYPMKSKKSVASKLEIFYKEIENKRKKGENISIQTDLEFKQKKIYELNSKHNTVIFSIAIRGDKAFAAEQKIRELNKRIFRLKSLEKRDMKFSQLKPYEIIRKSSDNMNSLISRKYSIALNEIEEKSSESE